MAAGGGSDPSTAGRATKTERAPTVPELFVETGLIHTYTRDPAPAAVRAALLWTAIDARTGATTFEVYSGSDLGFNSDYAGLAALRDG